MILRRIDFDGMAAMDQSGPTYAEFEESRICSLLLDSVVHMCGSLCGLHPSLHARWDDNSSCATLRLAECHEWRILARTSFFWVD